MKSLSNIFGCETHLKMNQHLPSAMKSTYNVLYEQEREKTWIEWLKLDGEFLLWNDYFLSWIIGLIFVKLFYFQSSNQHRFCNKTRIYILATFIPFSRWLNLKFQLIPLNEKAKKNPSWRHQLMSYGHYIEAWVKFNIINLLPCVPTRMRGISCMFRNWDILA